MAALTGLGVMGIVDARFSCRGRCSLNLIRAQLDFVTIGVTQVYALALAACTEQGEWPGVDDVATHANELVKELSIAHQGKVVDISSSWNLFYQVNDEAVVHAKRYKRYGARTPLLDADRLNAEQFNVPS